MILKRGSVINYGIPYQGSKTRLIDKIATMFPPADHFYDLFGGGFSVSHYMLEHRKKSYKQFHYNELRPGMCELISDAIAGKYNYDNYKPEWISRERFFAEKETNAFIKIIWSFGNNGERYIFGKEIEQQKRSMHNAIVFNEFDDFMKNTFGISEWPNSLTTTGKRIYLRKLNRHRRKQRIDLQQLEQLQRLQQLERLEQLQQLERLEQLELTNLDYKMVDIKPNSIIYCDIPYRGTGGYGEEFNYNEFLEWAADQENAVFISEYNIDDPRLALLKKIKHRSTFSATKTDFVTIEKVYGNKKALSYFHHPDCLTVYPDGSSGYQCVEGCVANV